MVLNLSDKEIIRMKGAVLDSDGDEALVLIKEYLKRLEQQKHSGMKSHLDN